jgi:DNA end-binding protein Ku
VSGDAAPEALEAKMAGRPYWQGQLKISLVSFGIELFPAAKSLAGIRFHQIDRATGQRVRHLNVIDDNQPVDNSEIVKGYEYSKGQYIVIEPAEIAKLRIPTKSVIEVHQFVDLGELSPSFFEEPYFVAPHAKESPDAFAVVRKALEQTHKAAMGEIAFAGREHLVAIMASPDKSFRGLMAYTLRYGEELRDSADYDSAFPKQDVDKKQLAMATELIRAYSSPLDMNAYKDDYEEALHRLIEAKQKNMPLPIEEEKPKRGKVTDLMEALRRSVTQAKRPPVREKEAATKHAEKKGPMLVKPGTRKHKAA